MRTPTAVGRSRGSARNPVDRINPVTCEVDLKTVERLQLELKIEAGVQRLPAEQALRAGLPP